MTQAGWRGSFYYSSEPLPGDIPWVETYRSYFDVRSLPKNMNYYAVFLFEKENKCVALSYGKSHFYLRQHCDFDFGIELAKRIADEYEIKQTASKRFQGKKKKDIKSYGANMHLDIESGESVEYLQASVIHQQQELFGKTGKFGASALLAPDRSPEELGAFLDKLYEELGKTIRFKLPRTTIVTDQSEVVHFDHMLINELQEPRGTTDFSQNSYDLYGVDFIFSTDGSFKLWCPDFPKVELTDLSMGDVKDYITEHHVSSEDVLSIRIQHIQEGRPLYTQSIKESIDYIIDGEKVLLSGGKWMRFNQDYLDYLDDYVRGISVEETEEEFKDIAVTETEFNSLPSLRERGYESADKNFDIFRTRSSTPIEAWDLKKGNTVYAVKFATAQKIGYVYSGRPKLLNPLRSLFRYNIG